MLEFVVYSVFIGSLGLEALLTSNWLYRRQLLLANQNQVEEEEVLNQYESQMAQQPHMQVNGSPPKTGDWEYKIVRASSDLFRDPKVFRKLCKEEKQAGWILLEKLDDSRVRFRRPLGLRAMEPERGPIDPYRCHYGPSLKLPTWVGPIAIVACIIIPAYVGYSIMLGLIESRRQPGNPSADTPQSVPEAPRTIEETPESEVSIMGTGASLQ